MADIVPRLFFLNGQLHRTEKIVKTQNSIFTYNFETERRVEYTLSQVRKEYQKAFKTVDVAKMLRYPLKRLKTYVARGMVTRPSSRIHTPATLIPGSVYWSEDEIINLRNELYDLWPKKNGLPVGKLNLVSHAELVSQFNGQPSYFIKNEDGALIQVWRAV